MNKKNRPPRRGKSSTEKGASFERQTKLARKGGWLILLGAVVCVGLVTFALLSTKKAAPPSSLGVVSSLAPQSSSKAASIPSSVVPVAPSSVAPVPSSFMETAPPLPPPVFAFAPEEVEQLNLLLGEWAQQKEEGEEDGHNVAVFFLDVETGLSYLYNQETKFEIASLVKAPYAMYLYQLAEQGQCDLNENFHITKEFVQTSAENSGKIKDDPDLPKDFTVNELLYYMLRYSDTAAQRALMLRYPAGGYKTYAAGLGLHWPEDVRGLTSGKITALDAGVYLQALYTYMQNGQFGPQLKENLTNSRNRMIASQYPIARKYGWDANAYHDMAVVYAPHPYLLAILTDKSAGTSGETATFGKISRKIEEIMQPKWQSLEEYLGATQ